MSASVRAGLAFILVSVAALGWKLLFSADQRSFEDDAETQNALQWMSPAEHVLDEEVVATVNWRPVVESAEPHAELMLKSAAVVELTENQAKELTDSYSAPSDGKPFLLRGLVRPQNGTGGTTIYKMPNGYVYVAGGTLSHSPVKLRKQCFVAWLAFVPRGAYVSFGVAE